MDFKQQNQTSWFPQSSKMELNEMYGEKKDHMWHITWKKIYSYVW